MSVLSSVDDEVDVWLQPAENVQIGIQSISGQASSTSSFINTIHGGSMRRGVHALDYGRNRLANDPDLSRLNYRKEELKVGMAEVKTYSCLHQILDNLVILLTKWKGTTEHPAYKRCLELMEGQGPKRSMILDRRFRKLKGEDQDIAIAAKNFCSVFKDPQNYDSLVSTVSITRSRIARIIFPTMNSLLPKERQIPLEVWDIIWSFTQVANRRIGHKMRLKVNDKEREEAVLEDELVTDAFKAAADLSGAILGMLFQEDLYLYVKQQQRSGGNEDDDATNATHMAYNVRHRCSVLIDLLDGGLPDIEDNTKLISALKRGHYKTKQLGLTSIEHRTDGARGICGQSSGMAVMARTVGLKINLTVWDTTKRKVAYSASVCHFGCKDMVAFVIKGELYVVLLSDPHPGHFFFFVMRCKIESQKNKMLSANSWPNPVITREVATGMTCDKAIFHMFETDDGEMAWLAFFRDMNGVHIAFFDSNSGEEIGRQHLNLPIAGIEAIKGDKAILYESAYNIFVIYQLSKRNAAEIAKMPMQTVFPELDEGKCRYLVEPIALKALFDQSDNNCFVLISPDDDLAYFDMAALKEAMFRGTHTQIRTRPKRILEVFHPGTASHDNDAESIEYFEQMFEHEDDRDRYGRAHGDLTVLGHCLVDGVVFYLALQGDQLRLRTTDLYSQATFDLCQFALGSLECRHNPGEEACSVCVGTNLIEMRKSGSPGHYVPYAFRKSSSKHYQTSTNCSSYLWTLVPSAKYSLHYCKEAKSLYIAGVGDNNFVEVKFLLENANRARAGQVKKQREVQAKWISKKPQEQQASPASLDVFW